MNNLSIRSKLALAFGVLTLIVVMVAVFALKTVSDSYREFQQFVNGVNARTLASHQLREAVDQRAISARNIVLVTNDADKALEKATVLKAHAEVVRQLDILSTLSKGADVSPEARALIEDIVRVEMAYAPVALEIVDLGLKGQAAQATTNINEKCRPLLAELVKASEKYNAFATKTAEQMLEGDAQRFTNQRNALILVCVLIVLLAVTAGIYITKAITGPIAQAVSVAEAVAAGDLGTPIDTARNDEIGLLLNAMQTMQTGLARVVSSVRQGSEGVATASAEIAAGNHDLSARTESQASALQETAASMEQLSVTVKNNSEAAVAADNLATSASAIANQGGKAVEDVVATMRDISTSSQKIADIISVIDGIAFQTNILALNAAVEAARAGEQGRGFAVVATEVRSLAGRSAEAAKEIKQLITTSLETVERGTSLADTAGSRMTEIVQSIGQVAGIIGEISAASREQSLGVSQVGEAITQMDQATQQNAALVEEMAAAASSLQTQSDDLVHVVSEFKLAAGSHGGGHGGYAAKPAPKIGRNSFPQLSRGA